MWFSKTPYVSGTTTTMKSILKDVEEGLAVSKQNDDVILDIGGNDGTMLSYSDQKLVIKLILTQLMDWICKCFREVHKDRGPI